MNCSIKYFCMIQTLFCTTALFSANTPPARPLMQVATGALLKRVDNLVHTLDSVNQTVNNGIQETNKRLDALTQESNQWRDLCSEARFKRSSNHAITRATTAIITILLITTALVLFYHDHTKAAQEIAPLPTKRFIDRFKNHLFSKSTGFFCLGALAYRQLCV